MAYRGRGRGGRGGDDRGDQRPQYGGGGGRGGGDRGSFVWPPPASTPRPVSTGYRAPMVLPHQAAYGAPAAAAPPVSSFSPAPAAAPVTIRPPSSSASPAPPSAPAPRQLVQGVQTRAPEPAPAFSAPSAATLAKEVEKKLFVSENALAPPAAAASAAVAAAQAVAASDAEDGTDVDLAPVSKKGLAHPARPGLGTVGKKVMIRANHFLVDVADNNLFHYDVAINPKSKSRQTNREVLSELIKLHGKTALGGKLPAYDGRKSLYTAGSLPFESEEFVVTLDDPEKKDKERAEREYKITIRIAGTTDLYHLHQFLRGRQRDMPQETIQVLDVVLRESPSWNYATVSRSFFSTTFGHRGDIGEGLECWRGYYQSLRPTQMGLSLNIDISATSFFKPVTVIKFVEEFLNIRDASCPLSDRDRVKIKKALRGVRIETSHQQDQIRRYKITGLTPIPMSQLIFPVDDKGTRQTVVQYFWDKYNYRLKYGSWPCLHAGSDSRAVYLPMEVCKIVEGQRYSKKLNDRQVTNILRATCKRPQEREQSIRDMVVHNNYAEDKFAQEFGIKVCSNLVSVPARVLPPPLLKYNDSGREKTCAPSVGQWNMINKKMINGGTIDNWTCLNFSRMRPEEVQMFCMDLTHMCNATGMNVNPRPFVEVRSAAPNHIENALRDVHRRATQMAAQQGTGSQLQLLIVILPDVSGSYGKIKRVCETDIGIVSQCCLPKHASSRPNKQYLENVALKVNVKVGGRNTVLERAFVRNGIPFVSEVPTIIFGADVTHPPPGEDSASSIAAVVASMDWTEITKYRGLVSAQPHRQEIIEDLFTVSKDPQKGHNVNGGMIRELLIAFRRKTNRRPERIIFYRDDISEGQFSHVLLHEMDAIRKACASLEEGYLPPVTFVVVQKRHHTRLFPEVHGRRDMTDKSGNILPGTVVDQKICHPTEFDFYLCSHAGIQGTSWPTHYHVLYDENHFTADELQSLTNNVCYTYARCTRAVAVVLPPMEKDSSGGSATGSSCQPLVCEGHAEDQMDLCNPAKPVAKKLLADGNDERTGEVNKANIFYRGITAPLTLHIDLDVNASVLADLIQERSGMSMVNQGLSCNGKKLKYDTSLRSQGVQDLSTVFLQPRLQGGSIDLGLHMQNEQTMNRMYTLVTLANGMTVQQLLNYGCLLMRSFILEVTKGLSTGYTWSNLQLGYFTFHNNRVSTRIHPTVPLSEMNLRNTLSELANILETQFTVNGSKPPYFDHLLDLLRKKVPAGAQLDQGYRYILESHISFMPSLMRDGLLYLLFCYYESLNTARKKAFDKIMGKCALDSNWHVNSKGYAHMSRIHTFAWQKHGVHYGKSQGQAFLFMRNYTTHAPGNSVDQGRTLYIYGNHLEIAISRIFGQFFADLLYNLYLSPTFRGHIHLLLQIGVLAHSHN